LNFIQSSILFYPYSSLSHFLIPNVHITSLYPESNAMQRSALGLQSLPVAFGIEKAKWLTVATIDITQVAVAAYLYYIGETTYALVLLGLIAPQVFFQFKFFLPDPVANDVKYQASAQPFLVFGILATALAVGNHGPL
jgi:4-hydroxybenzoate polyprenyltransferase